MMSVSSMIQRVKMLFKSNAEKWKDEPIEMSSEFRTFRKQLAGNVRKTIRKSKRMKKYNICDFEHFFKEIDEQTVREKVKLYQELFKHSQDHQTKESEAREYLHYLENEIARIQQELDIRYEQLANSLVVYTRNQPVAVTDNDGNRQA